MGNTWVKGNPLTMAAIVMDLAWKFTHYRKTMEADIEQQWNENLKTALEGWERVNSCIASIISIIANMLNTIYIEDKVNKSKIKTITNKLEKYSEDIKTLDTQVKELCSRLVILINENNHNERQRHLNVYDFQFEILSINIKSCVHHILLIKEELQNASKQAQAKSGTAETAENTSLVQNAGGPVENSSVFAKFTSKITSWKETNNAAEVQAGYEKLEYDVRHLDIELLRLEQLMEAQKRYRLKA